MAFAVPPPVQAELAVAAVQRGKSVFLAPPMAGDIAGAEELLEAVQRSKVVSRAHPITPGPGTSATTTTTW